MKKVYYLATCATCQKIIASLGGLDHFEHREIKSQPITAQELDAMKQLSGSYESLFTRRSMQYKARNLKDQTLTEDDYRNLILDHYSFLARPVFIIGDKIYIGNSKKSVDGVRDALNV